MQNNWNNDMTNIERQQIEEILHLIQQNRFSEAVEKSKKIILESQFNEQTAYNLLCKMIMILENFLEANYKSVQLKEQQQCFEQILELYELTIQKYPSQNQFLHMKATALFNFKKVNESLELCDLIISKSPQEIDGYILKSKALKQCGKQEQIIEMWRQFVSQFCEVVEGYQFLIQALETEENYNELVMVYDKAISKFPDKQVFLQKKGLNLPKLIGEILHKLKTYLPAIQIFDELIQKEKKETQYYEMKIKSLTKYKKQLSKQLETDNKDDDLNRIGCNNVQVIQDWINEQMKTCYAQALQETANECLELKRINFLFEINQKEEARILLDNMIKKYPTNIEGYLIKTNILQDEKKFDEIIELFDEAISQQPENVELYENKARQLEQQQKWVEALKCINQALSKSPDSLHYYLQKFKSLQQLNLIKTARQCCRMIPNVYYDTDQEMEQCDF